MTSILALINSCHLTKGLSTSFYLGGGHQNRAQIIVVYCVKERLTHSETCLLKSQNVEITEFSVKKRQ